MNEKLQQAITAVRNGQENEAQLLLAQVLKEDPQETQAWFLLSTLVDSEQKKKAYLGKVLALDPGHPMAKKMLARLQEKSEPVAESQIAETDPAAETLDAIPDGFEEEVVQAEKLDEASFASMEDQEPKIDELVPGGAEVAAEGFDLPEAGLFEADQAFLADELGQYAVEETAAEEAALPDWLEEIPEAEPAPAAVAVTQPTTNEEPEVKPEVAPTSPPAKKEPAPKKADLERQRLFLNRIYYALVIVAVIIFLVILVQIWQLIF